MAFRPEIKELAKKLDVEPLPPRLKYEPDRWLPPGTWQSQVERNRRWRAKRVATGGAIKRITLSAPANQVLTDAMATGRYRSANHFIQDAILGTGREPLAQVAMDELMSMWGFTTEAEATSMALQWLARYSRVHRLESLSLAQIRPVANVHTPR